MICCNTGIQPLDENIMTYKHIVINYFHITQPYSGDFVLLKEYFNELKKLLMALVLIYFELFRHLKKKKEQNTVHMSGKRPGYRSAELGRKN